MSEGRNKRRLPPFGGPILVWTFGPLAMIGLIILLARPA